MKLLGENQIMLMHDKNFYSVLFILRWVHSCFDIILFVDHSVELKPIVILGLLIKLDITDILHWVY